MEERMIRRFIGWAGRVRIVIGVAVATAGLLVAPLVLADTQAPAPWGLDRIDQRALPLNNAYTYENNGSGVSVYVVGTGVRASHYELGGRVRTGYSSFGDGSSATNDCQGNGTHLAATVAGAGYGVAKRATIVPVRVLNCQGSGTASALIAGLDWIVFDHTSQPAVALVPFSNRAADTSIDAAVNRLITDGVSVVVASGNTAEDACNTSPARVSPAITVAATSSTDQRPSWSSFGTCLDVFAPGVNITSAWSTSDSSTNTISGGSTASAHAAGAAALLLQRMPTASPQQIRDAMVNAATTNVVGNPGAGSPNRLLYTGSVSSPPPPPPPSTGCSLPESYAGSLSGTGDADIHPNGTYFQSAAGTHTACLRGPSGVDFDLALYQWIGSAWGRVAVSQSASSSENITYYGAAGYYYWRVYSYAGSGSYTFGMRRP